MRPLLGSSSLRTVNRAFSTLAIPEDKNFQYVPKHNSPATQDVQILRQFYDRYSKIFVLTGAGISTESGIPDYRSAGVGLYNRTNHRPMYIQEFLKSPAARKRYWARNYYGWPTFSKATPNQAHQIVRKWELEGKVNAVITQNVDRLHNKAGSLPIELHGTGYEVICLQCDEFREDRHEFQKKLVSCNPHFAPSIDSQQKLRPDGDIDLDDVEQFVIPLCPKCGDGILKPDIVFFGDNVPKPRVQHIYDTLESCDSILILGSSLQVYSSYRFALRAKELGIPICIVTLGATRADHLAEIKLSLRVGEILSLVAL